MTDLGMEVLNYDDLPIGEIAVRIPGATAVFRKHKLDYCCGGALSLAEAARKRGVALEEIERQLAVLIPQKADMPEAPEQIIDLIISRYHDVHRRELPELIQLSRRVERVHADHPNAPIGLADLLTKITDDLGAHMQKEEQVLFPMMRSLHPMVSAPIAVMRAEHSEHGESLDWLFTLTSHMQTPEGACGTWRALYAGLRKFADDLVEHIHVENNILFPRFMG